MQLLKVFMVAHENREVLKEHLKALGIDPCPGERFRPGNRLQDGGKLLVVLPLRRHRSAQRLGNLPGLGVEKAKRIGIGREQRSELFSHALGVLGSPNGRERAQG